jgi:hypothetical protein
VRVYKFAWGVATAVPLAWACVYDVASGGLARMLAAGLLTALFSGFLAFAITEELADRWTWVRRATVWTGVGAVAIDAFSATWGRQGAGLCLTLLLVSPVLVEPCRAQFVAWSSRRRGGPPESLTTRDLRRRWEWTTAEVLHPGASVARRLVLVEERRRLLDEIQQRDLEHFDDWLPFAVPDRGRDRPYPRGR